jgi:hypothetical protein
MPYHLPARREGSGAFEFFRFCRENGNFGSGSPGEHSVLPTYARSSLNFTAMLREMYSTAHYFSPLLMDSEKWRSIFDWLELSSLVSISSGLSNNPPCPELKVQ